MHTSISKLFVKAGDTLQTVMDRMNNVRKEDASLPRGIALVVDTGKRLLGIVTDGDVRREFSKGTPAGTPVSKIMTKKPGTITVDRWPSNILPVLSDKIKAGSWPKERLEKIIIVDKKNHVLDVVSFYDLIHTSDVRYKHIGIVGLGYVGLTLALTLADLGFRVKGHDNNKKVMEALGKGRAHFFEEGLDELLTEHIGKNFVLVDDFKGGNNADIYIVAVGTPLTSKNQPDLTALKGSLTTIGKVLKPGDAVVLRSTVPIGTTRNFVIPLLEKLSRLKGGEDFLVSFAPERTVAGKALEELKTLPQIIGGVNHAASELIANMFSFLTRSIIHVDSLEAAEMVKLINNSYRDVTFAFANEVSLVAQEWNVHTKKLIEAANYGYTRSTIPLPSPGVGGYCLEKDPFLFMASAKEKINKPKLPEHARSVTNAMRKKILTDIISFLKKKKKGKKEKILVLGLAFKGRPETSDLRGSTSLAYITDLQSKGYKNIWGCDPSVFAHELEGRGITLTNPKEGFKNADVVLLMTNNPAFDDLPLKRLLETTKKPVLFFDAWNIASPADMQKLPGVLYKHL